MCAIMFEDVQFAENWRYALKPSKRFLSPVILIDENVKTKLRADNESNLKIMLENENNPE